MKKAGNYSEAVKMESTARDNYEKALKNNEVWYAAKPGFFAHFQVADKKMVERYVSRRSGYVCYSSLDYKAMLAKHGLEF